MENIINLEIKISNEPSSGRLKVVSDKQLYDEWRTEHVKQNDFEFSEQTLTAIYERLCDISKCNRVGLGDPIFKIDGEVFAEKIGGDPLKLNKEFPQKLIQKYREYEKKGNAIINKKFRP
jgi:hypothetical protein